MEKSQKEKTKEGIPAVNTVTGISTDYTNNFIALNLITDGNFDAILKIMDTEKFKKYGNWFDEEAQRYDLSNLINDKNRQNVGELDNIVDTLNDFLQNPDKYDIKQIEDIWKRVKKLISNKDD